MTRIDEQQISLFNKNIECTFLGKYVGSKWDSSVHPFIRPSGQPSIRSFIRAQCNIIPFAELMNVIKPNGGAIR